MKVKTHLWYKAIKWIQVQEKLNWNMKVINLVSEWSEWTHLVKPRFLLNLGLRIELGLCQQLCCVSSSSLGFPSRYNLLWPSRTDQLCVVYKNGLVKNEGHSISLMWKNDVVRVLGLVADTKIYTFFEWNEAFSKTQLFDCVKGKWDEIEVLKNY